MEWKSSKVFFVVVELFFIYFFREFNPNPKANKEIKEVETIAGNLQNLDIKYNIFDSHDYAKANRSNLLSTNPQFPSLTTHEAWNFQEEKKDDALLSVG